MYQGEIRKMLVNLNAENEVQYQFILHDSVLNEDNLFPANELVGKHINITFQQEIICKSCAKQTPKSFQGFCYSCFTKVPEASECIIHPELCKAHVGKGRDIEWEEKYHNRPHIVYLAANDTIKVGVTSPSQVPIRWIDQGAYKAIILATAPNRYLAGVIEVALKSTFTDKTNWRKMLCNQIDESIDLEEVKWELEEILPEDISKYISEDDTVHYFHYPVLQFPEKVKSTTLDKSTIVEGKLIGIKGQYLLFENGTVMNIRSHEGYKIKFSIL